VTRAAGTEDQAPQAQPEGRSPQVAARGRSRASTAQDHRIGQAEAVATPSTGQPSTGRTRCSAGPSCTMQMQAWGEANDATFTALKNDEGQVASDASLVAGDVATGNVAQVDIDTAR